MLSMCDLRAQMPRPASFNEQVRQHRIFQQMQAFHQHILYNQFGSPNLNGEVSPPSSVASTSPSVMNFGEIIQPPSVAQAMQHQQHQQPQQQRSQQPFSPQHQQPQQFQLQHHHHHHQQQQQQPLPPLTPASSTEPASPTPVETACSSVTNSGRRNRRGRSKRRRTIFTPEQLKRLEREFANQMYLVGEDRIYLARALNLTEAQVKVWFQNRRIKFRKLEATAS